MTKWQGVGKGKNALFPVEFIEHYSLQLGKESTAFSIIFQLDLRSKSIVHISYGKTLITVKAQLTFSQVDMILNGYSDEIECGYVIKVNAI